LPSVRALKTAFRAFVFCIYGLAVAAPYQLLLAAFRAQEFDS